MASGSTKSLKTTQTRLGPPDLNVDELDSNDDDDDDDVASVASEQFYENIVSIALYMSHVILKQNYNSIAYHNTEYYMYSTIVTMCKWSCCT